MKEKKESHKREPCRSTGTRDAVETAIDLAKRDPSISWEEQVEKSRRRITQWEDDKEKCHELKGS